MAFQIAMTPTRAFNLLNEGESIIETYDELAALQERLQCDVYITLPDEYGQKRVFLYDP